MQIKIEKLIFGGQGLTRTDDGQVVFVWDVLPEEIVEVKITKRKKNILEGVLEKIIVPSPYRIEPKENHYTCCSPWQIITPEQEKFWKIQIAKETFKKIGRLQDDFNIEIIDDERNYGYRNKIEYQITEKIGEAQLAFFERNSNKKIRLTNCELADPKINLFAEDILNWINQEKIQSERIKSLIIRSNQKGETIATLFVKDKIKFTTNPIKQTWQKGWQVYFSSPNFSDSITTELIYEKGQNYLIDKIKDTQIKYDTLSFFQINQPIFEKALIEIEKHLDINKEIVDYYGGVGSISLPLANKFKKGIIVDISKEAINRAKENIILNKINNCEAVCKSAENIIELIKSNKIIILDPPRAGLDNKIIKKLLEENPCKIIYLSCNPSTQARDISLLTAKYNVELIRLYNFFPRTPHIESLAILTPNL